MAVANNVKAVNDVDGAVVVVVGIVVSAAGVADVVGVMDALDPGVNANSSVSVSAGVGVGLGFGFGGAGIDVVGYRLRRY